MLLLCCAMPAMAQQSVIQMDMSTPTPSSKCVDRVIDKDSYRLEPLRSSEVSDRDALLQRSESNLKRINSEAVYGEAMAESRRIDSDADRFALDTLEAHGITFGPGDQWKNYGTILLSPGPTLYGLDTDKKFAMVQMEGNFLLIANFTEKPCGIAHSDFDMDAFQFSKRPEGLY